MRRSLSVALSQPSQVCSFSGVGAAEADYHRLAARASRSGAVSDTVGRLRLQGRGSRDDDHRVSAGGNMNPNRSRSTGARRTNGGADPSRGDDKRANSEFSCFPQNEVRRLQPAEQQNFVIGANDYRLGWASSGFYATTMAASTGTTAWIPFPSLPALSRGEGIDCGGDPALVYDRARASPTTRHRLQPRGRHERRLRAALVERRLHVEPSRASRWASPTQPQLRRSRRSAPARRRHRGLHPENQTTPPFGSTANFSVTFDDKEWIDQRAEAGGSEARTASGPCRRRL